MSTVSRINVAITGDDTQLNSTLNNSTKKVALWSAAAIAAAAAVTTSLVKSGLESADAMAKQAAQLQTTSKDLATLKRAAEMAGVGQEQLTTASRQLTIMLSQAQSGSGLAAEAMQRLGLSVQQVASLPLSERISTINQALRDNVSANERAAVAAQLFGSRGALAIAQVSPDTISQAADQVERLGGALSDVDAAKIEIANDAMSQLGLSYTNLTQRLAVQFAPILAETANSIADLIAENVDLEATFSKAFDIAITGAGHAADAFQNLTIIVHTIRAALYGMAAGALEAIQTVEMQIERLTGQGDAITSKFSLVADAVKSAINPIGFLWGNAMSSVEDSTEQTVTSTSDMLQQMRDQFESSQAAAFDAVEGENYSVRLRRSFDEIAARHTEMAEQIVKERREANALGFENVEDMQMAEKDEQDKFEQQLEKHREYLDRRLEQIRFSNLTADEIAQEQYEKDIEALTAAQENELLTLEEFNNKKLMIEQSYADAVEQLEKQRFDSRINMARSFLSNIATLMDTNSRSMFEIGKAAAISEATITGIRTTMEAFRSGMETPGPWAPAVAAAYAASAAVATGAQIARISSTSFGSRSNPTPMINVGDPVAAAGGAGAGGGGDSRSLFIQGDFDSGQLFSGDSVRRMMDAISEAQQDGYQVVMR